MKEHRFSGEEPVMIFDFLSLFDEESGILGITEAKEYISLPQFLTGKVTKQFWSKRNGSSSGGATWWPETIQSFLRTYDTPDDTIEAIN